MGSGNVVSLLITLIVISIVFTVGLTVLDTMNQAMTESDQYSSESFEVEQERFVDEFSRAVDIVNTVLTGVLLTIWVAPPINRYARRRVAERAGLQP